MIKVASYCRVSTDKEDQANSFESQQKFFREYIDRNPDWELYEVYADEGITGTSTKKRAQFNRMINDAYHGRFKLIITKEVSRFSRNLLDTIAYTRELKALGIGVIFMSDGFNTLDPDAELRLSIMGSIAQEESRKTSSRVKWGQTRQMEKGVVFGKSMLGYDVEHGKMTINPEGAELVRLIFHKYGIEKKGTSVISRELREAGYKTYSGNTKWSNSHIVRILKNEKYVGDLVQQKSITPDYLTHAKKYNHGEEDLVIIQNHHEPIISRELWDIVQEELNGRVRNKSGSGGHSNRYIFSGKMFCGECGSRFISRCKTRNSGTKYMRWGCYVASNEGKRKADTQGNEIGCDIGKQISNDLAMDMLTNTIRKIPVDFQWIIQNVSNLVVGALQADDVPSENPDRIQRQIDQLTKKKENLLDAFISGDLTKDEMQLMKKRYDEKLTALRERLAVARASRKISPEKLLADITKKVKSIVTCRHFAEPYYKALLDKMIINKDSTIEVSLTHLPQTWVYEMTYHKSSNDTKGSQSLFP